jgi:hypothetical protein
MIDGWFRLVDFLFGDFTMPRVSQSDRIKLWTDRLNRFAVSGKTVTAFCTAERCSMPAFYQWKRRLKSVRPAAFAELSVVTASPTLPCIRLSNGVRIDLGTEQATVKTIISQVMEHAMATATNEASSS